MLVLSGCASNTAEVNAANEDLQIRIDAFETANIELKEKLNNANGEIEDLTLKLDQFNELEQELTDLQASHKKETKVFEEKITKLQDENTELLGKNKELSGKIAAAEQKEKRKLQQAKAKLVPNRQKAKVGQVLLTHQAIHLHHLQVAVLPQPKALPRRQKLNKIAILKDLIAVYTTPQGPHITIEQKMSLNGFAQLKKHSRLVTEHLRNKSSTLF